MTSILNAPIAVFFFVLGGLWVSSWLGFYIRRKFRPIKENPHDLDLVAAAILTLLGLLIGFSFSMAISRYDQRKDYEAEEANAIGTEYARADLLPEMEATRIKGLLAKYLDQRIEYYQMHDSQKRSELASQTTHLQHEMWVQIKAAGVADPTPLTTTVVTGMNDVLNTQSYTQAAWWNRLPVAVWVLMGAIALICSALIGYQAERPKSVLFVIVPLVVAISFLLTADIDSPRGGLILVAPQNLISLQKAIASGE